MAKRNIVSFSLTDEVLEYLEEQSKKTGLNKSALVTMIINEYKKKN